MVEVVAVEACLGAAAARPVLHPQWLHQFLPGLLLPLTHNHQLLRQQQLVRAVRPDSLVCLHRWLAPLPVLLSVVLSVIPLVLG